MIELFEAQSGTIGARSVRRQKRSRRRIDAWRSRRSSGRGFTLIELMITVAIIGILAAIAYPTYLDKVRKSRRVEAKSLLMKAANREEQLFSANNRYLNSMSALGLSERTENGYYNVSVNSGNYKGMDYYTITAKAQNDQVNDTCRTMLYDSKGLKTAWSGEAASQGRDVSNTCW